MTWWRNLKQAVSIDQIRPDESVNPIRGLRLVKTAFEDPNLLNKRLLSILTQEEKLLQLSTLHVLLVGFNVSDARSFSQTLSAVHVASCNSVARLEDVRATRHNFTHLIVNADAFGDANDVVDALLSFRKRNSNYVVILTSSKIIADDLGVERRPICDATLKLPISLSRLVDGIMAASANNRELRLPS